MKAAVSPPIERDLFISAPARPAPIVHPAQLAHARVFGVDAPLYLKFALAWHDEKRFRTWLLGLRNEKADGASFMSELAGATNEDRRQPSGAYSAIVLLRAAVLAGWIRAYEAAEHFDPLSERELVNRIYALNEENESLQAYLARDAAQEAA